MYPTKIVAILLFILVNQADAIVYELGLNYGYDKSIYGSSRQNSLTTRTYSMGVALYLFEQTAIDLNYSEVRDLNISNERVNVASNTDLIMYQTNVQTYVYGIGLKQQLLPKGAFIIPTISAGYAKQLVYTQNSYTVENTSSSAQTNYSTATSKYQSHSMFGEFTLMFKLTNTFSLKGSVKTLFPAFEFNKAKDSLKYLAGFSWIF